MPYYCVKFEHSTVQLWRTTLCTTSLTNISKAASDPWTRLESEQT